MYDSDTSLLTINAPIFPIASESMESTVSSWSTLVDSSSESGSPPSKTGGCDSGFDYFAPGTYFIDNAALASTSTSPWDFSAFEPVSTSATELNNSFATGLAAAELPDFLIAAAMGDVCSPPKASDVFLPDLNNSDLFDGSLGLDIGWGGSAVELSPGVSTYDLFGDESLAAMINSYIQL